MYGGSPPSEGAGLSSHGGLNVSERQQQQQQPQPQQPQQPQRRPVKVPIKFESRTDGRAQPPEVVIRAIGYSGGGNRGGNRSGAASPGLPDFRQVGTPSPLSSIGGSAYGGRGLTPEALLELVVPGEEAVGDERGHHGESYPESHEEQTRRQLEMHELEGEGMGRSGGRGEGGGSGAGAGGQPRERDGAYPQQYQPRQSPARQGQHPAPHEQQYQPQAQSQPQPQPQPPQQPLYQQQRSYPPPQEQPYATTPQSQGQLHPQQHQQQHQQQHPQHQPRYQEASPPQQPVAPYGHDSRGQSVMQRREDLWDRTQQTVAAGIAQRGAATALAGGAGANFGGGGGSIASGGESGRNPLVMVLLEEVWSRVQDWEARLGQAEEGVGDAAGLAYMHVGQLVTQAKVRSAQRRPTNAGWPS